VRAVAERMRDALPELLPTVNAAILDSAPVLASDPVLAHLTRASTNANVTRWVAATADRPDRPVGVDVPPEALDLARDVVRRGMERDGLLTAYRTGQNLVWARWMRCARDEGLEGEDLLAVLQAGSGSLFGFVDGILNAIAARMEQERDELIGGAPARHRETVGLILDGAPIAEARASARLGYELARAHTAAILWAEETTVEHGELERLALELARVLGARPPFSVSAGRAARWAWISGIEPDPDTLALTLEGMATDLFVALGSTRTGIAGFRDSHLEARAAQRLLMRNPQGPRRAAYADVQVVALASQDERRAAGFVADVLGPLARSDEELRETVRVFLQQDCSAARSAALLHTHRNTILKRIARAETLLPRPLAGRGLEVRLALELLRWSK
jgi:DNA-binding PucR family transcriptional regulator